MKTKLAVLLIFTALNSLSLAQLKSVSFSGAYSASASFKSENKVSRAGGFGGDIDITYQLMNSINISLTGGYRTISVEQDKFVLFKEWNWKYWKRYFGDVNDPNFYKSTQWVQSILKDSNYSAAFNPVQKMDLFPVLFTGSRDINLTENIMISPNIGAGLIFFSRRLYVEETWSKKFQQANNYVYTYSFRDMAENINGNPLALQGGIDAALDLGEYITLNGGIRYLYVIPTEGKMGYDYFPVKDLFSAKIGISFIY